MQANDTSGQLPEFPERAGKRKQIPHISIENDPMILGGPIQSGITEWLKGTGVMSDVVMSSRARAARNLAGFPFPPTASSADRSQIMEICRRCIESLERKNGSSIRWFDLRNSDPNDRRLLVERQLMSRQHARGRYSNGEGGPDSPRGVAVIEPEERISILVNEEDHLRVQVIRSGLNLESCLKEINGFDDGIEQIVDYAFHPQFGYLTACPTNVGTGLRLSVMVHLPALKITGELEKVRNAASDMGLAVRGLYGEGSQAAGEFYQISNQVTLGRSDEMLLREIESEVVPNIVRYEQHARAQLMNENRMLIEDRVYRSFGILQNARLLKPDEALEHLGMVRLGVICELLPEIPLETVHELLLLIQPGHLQRLIGCDLTQAERRIARAKIVRDRLFTSEEPEQGDTER
ncbi:MAG: protein arginine kinase [Phycisphaerales bacterium]